MSRPLPTLALILCAAVAHGADSEAELAAVDQLGRINGTVLACGYLELMPRIKGAMILYVRETREMGAAFEEATQSRYREVVGGDAACPARREVRQTVEQAVEGIKQAFPLNVNG